ncbi:MAG TPA: isoprenylcysteine carboxylmethyltransferase family protein, partial [Terriglobales bacterium]|nr:isoprenylcysteine carboxylmethyltransferase family protein [Terriglobales bacterium]
SVLIAVGFVIAACNPWIAVAALAMFAVIYVPVIRAEEKYLAALFPAYVEYAQQVPRLLPRLRPYRVAAGVDESGFSRELYFKHREYNAALGSALMIGALILKMVLVQH